MPSGAMTVESNRLQPLAASRYNSNHNMNSREAIGESQVSTALPRFWPNTMRKACTVSIPSAHQERKNKMPVIQTLTLKSVGESTIEENGQV